MHWSIPMPEEQKAGNAPPTCTCRLKPVHVLFYRVLKSGLVEIVRVLHERMEPSRHIDAQPEE